MKAMLEARIVAASTHFPEEREHGVLVPPACMMFPSQGSRIDAITPNSKIRERETTAPLPVKFSAGTEQ
jgi:hypothetical protein